MIACEAGTHGIEHNQDGIQRWEGDGYSGLEFVLLQRHGLVDDGMTPVTTDHDIQVSPEIFPTTPQSVADTSTRF